MLAISATERDSSVSPARSPPPAGTSDVRRLEREVGQDADHVGVAGPLAVAVDRRLDVADPGGHGGHRVRDRELGVVVGVDAPRDRPARRGSASRLARTSPMIATSSSVIVPPFVSHRTMRPRAGLASRPQGRQRVVAVGLVAVEEVLGVVDRLAPAIDDEADRVRDHVEVLGGRRAQHLDHVEQPALAEDRDDRGLGGDQLAQVRVVAGLVRAVAGRPERGEPGLLPAHRPGGREELDVLGVRARPAALDERHPVLVEHPRDAQLVGEREGDVLALRPVAQGRVVEDDRGASLMPRPRPQPRAPR